PNKTGYLRFRDCVFYRTPNENRFAAPESGFDNPKSARPAGTPTDSPAPIPRAPIRVLGSLAFPEAETRTANPANHIRHRTRNTDRESPHDRERDPRFQKNPRHGSAFRSTKS